MYEITQKHPTCMMHVNLCKEEYATVYIENQFELIQF